MSELSEEQRAAWVNALPNVPQEWAADLDGRGLPGNEALGSFMQALRDAGQNPPRNWDKE